MWFMLWLACATEPPPAPVVLATPAPEPVATAMVFTNDAGEPACPVMGDTVVPERAVASTVYDGMTYYFCCDSCEKKFAEDPAHYAHGHFLRTEGPWAEAVTPR